MNELAHRHESELAAGEPILPDFSLCGSEGQNRIELLNKINQ